MPRCEGRPNGACPAKANNNSVKCTQGDLFLCKDCEIFRFPHMASSKPTATVPSATTPSGSKSLSTCIADEQTHIECDDHNVQTAGQHCSYTHQLEACAGAVTCKDSVPETKLPFQSQVTLIPCELLFFVQGTFGQYPESSIKTTLLEFYRDDEIFSAKQLLIEAIEQTDKCLNIGSFTKKRYGNHKCKSSIDDIMNMVKLVDEHLCLDKLPTFCAVKRSRVPVIVEELSDMTAVRMELNQLRQHVEDLTKQVSSIPRCKCLSSKQSAEKASLRGAVNSVHDEMSASNKSTGRSLSVTPVLQTGSNSSTAVNALLDDDAYPALPNRIISSDTAGDPDENQASISTEMHSSNFAAIVKEDMHGFEEVNRQMRQQRKRGQRQYVVGDSTARASFLGVSKKVFVRISRLCSDTSVETIQNLLQSKGIKVISCFKYSNKFDRFSLMRVCISHSGEKKIYDPKLWPDGVVVRPSQFKSSQSVQDGVDVSKSAQHRK